MMIQVESDCHHSNPLAPGLPTNGDSPSLCRIVRRTASHFRFVAQSPECGPIVGKGRMNLSHRARRWSRRGFRSFLTASDRHHVIRRHIGTSGSCRPLQPIIRRQPRHAPCAMRFQPFSKFFDLLRRQLLNGGFDFNNGAHAGSLRSHRRCGNNHSFELTKPLHQLIDVQGGAQQSQD